MKGEWMTLREAAEYIGQSERWMRRAVSERTLPHYKMRGQLRFKRNDLDEYVAAAFRPSRRVM